MSTVPPGLTSSIGFRSQYDLGYQVSPIILQSGIVGVQGGLKPITDYLGGLPKNLDQAVAHFLPLPGSTLIDQAIGMYPFANVAVAANATIQQPLVLSMVMIAPVNQPGGYLTKLQLFTSLQNSLAQHNAAGGTYIVATPAFIYNNLLLVKMTDTSPELSAEDNKQVQISYQLDFIQPIVSTADATAALNGFMQKVKNGGKFNGQPKPGGNLSSSPANLNGLPGALGNAFGTFGAP